VLKDGPLNARPAKVNDVRPLVESFR